MKQSPSKCPPPALVAVDQIPVMATYQVGGASVERSTCEVGTQTQVDSKLVNSVSVQTEESINSMFPMWAL